MTGGIVMKCDVCKNKDFNKFIQEERPHWLIVICDKCGSIVEVYRTATLEERLLLIGCD